MPNPSDFFCSSLWYGGWLWFCVIFFISMASSQSFQPSKPHPTFNRGIEETSSQISPFLCSLLINFYVLASVVQLTSYGGIVFLNNHILREARNAWKQSLSSSDWKQLSIEDQIKIGGELEILKIIALDLIFPKWHSDFVLRMLSLFFCESKHWNEINLNRGNTVFSWINATNVLEFSSRKLCCFCSWNLNESIKFGFC